MASMARTSVFRRKISGFIVLIIFLFVTLFFFYDKEEIKHESEQPNAPNVARLELLRSKKGSRHKDDFEKEYPLLLVNEQLVVCFENGTDYRKLPYVTESPPTTEQDPLTTQRNHRRLLPTLHRSTTGDAAEPMIYFVTPTYPRREQIPEIIRLGQTLMHVPYLHWIVADDTDTCSQTLNHHLKKFGIPYTQLASPMPEVYRARKNAPRGVANRRAALNWIRTNGKKSGVLYFGDDDNTFELKLFSEIRYTKKVSMFPVGLIGDYAVSTPIVRNGKVEGFFDSWPAKRKWPVDMAGFAVSLEYLALSPNATMPFRAGYEEDEFLKSIGLKLQDIEPKANNCTEILVWHTQTKSSKAPTVRISMDRQKLDRLNLGTVLKQLEIMGVNRISETEGTTAQAIVEGSVKPLSYWFS